MYGYYNSFDKFPSFFVYQDPGKEYYEKLEVKVNWEKGLLVWIGKGLFDATPNANLKLE